MARRQKRFTKRPEKPRFRINHQIRVPKIRLVGDNMDEISEATGEKIESGVYPVRQAYEFANAVGLDLVEISPKADPPVCRIIDYKKFLFDRKKKDKELKAKTVKTVVKEIRFGPNTDDHDFDFKARHAERFLKDGAKVKAYVHFRGRTIVFRERGEVLLLRFIKHLEDFGSPEALPKMEGRRMFVMLAPKKTALKKPSKPQKAKPASKEAKPKPPKESKPDAVDENIKASSEEGKPKPPKESKPDAAAENIKVSPEEGNQES